ncbi:MAG: hypothetical protein ACRDDX_04180 [Cellulosilyticaceae bacterium]
MNKHTLNETFESITPSLDQKERMLKNILAHTSHTSKSTPKETPSKTNYRPLLGMAAGLLLVIGLGTNLDFTTSVPPQANPTDQPVLENTHNVGLSDLEILTEKITLANTATNEVLTTLSIEETQELLTLITRSTLVESSSLDITTLFDTASPKAILTLICTFESGVEINLTIDPEHSIFLLGSNYYHMSDALTTYVTNLQ